MSQLKFTTKITLMIKIRFLRLCEPSNLYLYHQFQTAPSNIPNLSPTPTFISISNEKYVISMTKQSIYILASRMNSSITTPHPPHRLP